MTTTTLQQLAADLATGPITLLAADMRTESTIDALATALESIDPQAYVDYLARGPEIDATVLASRRALEYGSDDVATILVDLVRSQGVARDAYDESNAYDDLSWTVDDLSSLLDDRLSAIDAYVTRDANDPSYLVITTRALDVVMGETDDLDVVVPSDELATEYLTRDSGRVPCSRYGSHSSDLAPTALAAARVVAYETGEPLTFATLDYVMGLAVNDSAEVAELILSADPSMGLAPTDVLDVDVIGQFVLDELTSKLAPGPWPHPNEPTTVDLGSFDTGDPYGSVMQLAFTLNDASYLVGGATDPTYRPSPLLDRDSLQHDEYELARELVEAIDDGTVSVDDVESAIDALSDVIDACKRWGVEY